MAVLSGACDAGFSGEIAENGGQGAVGVRFNG